MLAEIKKIEFDVRHSSMKNASDTFKALKMGITKAIRPAPKDAPQQDLQLFIRAEFCGGMTNSFTRETYEALTITCRGDHGDANLKTYVAHDLTITLRLSNTGLVAVTTKLEPAGDYSTHGDWVSRNITWTRTQETSCELARFDFDKFFTYVKRLCSQTSYFITLDPINFSL